MLAGAARRPSKVLIPESKIFGVPQKEMSGLASSLGEGRPTGTPSPPVAEGTGGRLGWGHRPSSRQGLRVTKPGAAGSIAAGCSSPDPC